MISVTCEFTEIKHQVSELIRPPRFLTDVLPGLQGSLAHRLGCRHPGPDPRAWSFSHLGRCFGQEDWEVPTADLVRLDCNHGGHGCSLAFEGRLSAVSSGWLPGASCNRYRYPLSSDVPPNNGTSSGLAKCSRCRILHFLPHVLWGTLIHASFTCLSLTLVVRFGASLLARQSFKRSYPIACLRNLCHSFRTAWR